MSNLSQAHWRDSARSVRFFIWDGKTAFPLLIFVLHISWITLAIALAAMLFFTVLNRFGFSPEVFFRWFRATLAGSRKLSIPWWEEEQR